jgi:hypothetical protein
MILNKQIICVSCSLVLILFACNSNFEIEKTSLTLNNTYFKEIKVKSSFNIILKQDSLFRVTIETSESSLQNISAYTLGDTLFLLDENPNKWRTNYQTPTVTIHFIEIEKFNIYAPGNISSDGVIQQNNFRFFSTQHIGVVNLYLNVQNLSLITGNSQNMGVYNLSGSAKYSNIWIRNTCSLNAKDLLIDDARIVNNSLNDCYVHTKNRLRVTLNSSGNIYFLGNPNEIVIDEQSATGKLINLE